MIHVYRTAPVQVNGDCERAARDSPDKLLPEHAGRVQHVPQHRVRAPRRARRQDLLARHAARQERSETVNNFVTSLNIFFLVGV